MGVKQCTITTERFIIEVISSHYQNQTVCVTLHDGTYIVYLLKIVNGKAFREQSYLSNLEKDIPQYKCQEFYDYIKHIVEDTLKWIEYWRELKDYRVMALNETEPEM